MKPGVRRLAGSLPCCPRCVVAGLAFGLSLRIHKNFHLLRIRSAAAAVPGLVLLHQTAHMVAPHMVAPHMLSPYMPRTALFPCASATWTWELTKTANSPVLSADARVQQHRAKGRGVGRPSERQRRPRKRFAAVVADQADWI
jgi:hypothetical protein